MRVIAEKEFRVKCASCESTLGITSSDLKFRLGMRYIVCPVCGEYGIINDRLLN